MSSAQKDFYRILGLNDSAEFAVIKAAYKALIMLYHPDRHIGDKDQAVKKSKDINEAYAVLIDPDKRKKYDAERLGKPEKITDMPEYTLNVINELKRALKESEAILKILNELD
jgi:DnaJ-class molecular chaperone